jgi:uncharacterized protein YndB with AHSA1/START domain
MASSRFVYVTYIRTTPEKLWQALIDPEFPRQYWVETWRESDVISRRAGGCKPSDQASGGCKPPVFFYLQARQRLQGVYTPRPPRRLLWTTAATLAIVLPSVRD